jgi:hypothetical protein
LLPNLLFPTLTWGMWEQPSALMQGNGLDAASIDMDHNAMLANNPTANAAFLKVFGSYVPGAERQNQLKSSPKGSTKLAMTSHEAHRSHKSKAAESRLNAKLASEMQNRLTAGSKSDSLMTPNFLAALSEAQGHNTAQGQMLSQQNKETMDAITMTGQQAHASHVLPRDLRQKFKFNQAATSLANTHILTPAQAAMRAAPQAGAQSLAYADSQPNPTGGNPSLAGRADTELLAAQGSQVSTRELIRQAAMQQMNAMPAPVRKQARAQQLSEVPAAGYYQQQAVYQPYQQPVYAVQPNYAQPMQPVEPAPMQMAYQTSQQAPSYGYGYVQPQQPSYFPAPAAKQQLMAPHQEAPPQLLGPLPAPTQELVEQPSDASVGIQTPQQIGEEAANAAAGTNWRQPDAVIKKGAKLSAAKKAKMIQQMAALRQQILGDYNKNTKAGDKALLMGPNSL